MEKAMIYAYTANNLGDDLFIYILCKRYPNTQFHLYAPESYKKTFSSIPNLKIIVNDDFKHKMLHQLSKMIGKRYLFRERHAKKCPIGVYVGGSLFMETTNWKNDVKNLRSMIDSHENLFILGANFGPFKTEAFWQAYEQLFKNVTDICFRDRASFELFHHLRNVRHASDIAFQLKPVRSLSHDNSVLLSVIYPSVRKDLRDFDTIYFHKMKTIAISFIEQGYDVKFMAFCEKEKDGEAIEEIVRIIPDSYRSNLSTYIYRNDIEEALETFMKSKAIIATRFHAMLLGWIFEKPVFPIIYSNKMKTVMDEAGFEGHFCEVKNIGELNIDHVMKTPYMKPIHIEKQTLDSNEQFLKLDQFLN